VDNWTVLFNIRVEVPLHDFFPFSTSFIHIYTVPDRLSLFVTVSKSLYINGVVDCAGIYCLLSNTLFPPSTRQNLGHLNMAPTATSPVVTLEAEDHARDAAFAKALHGASAEARGGLLAMRKKDQAAQKAAVDEYFKHWDNKGAATETEEIRQARREEYATLTRQ
jgi:hypothetical protein